MARETLSPPRTAAPQSKEKSKLENAKLQTTLLQFAKSLPFFVAKSHTRHEWRVGFLYLGNWRADEVSQLNPGQLNTNVGCMSLSKPRTCCMVGLFPGDSAVHKYPTRRLSTISRSDSTRPHPGRSLGSSALAPCPSLTNLLTETTVSAVPGRPVSSSINTTPKQYTSVSVLQLLSRPPKLRNPKSAIRGSKFSAKSTFEVTKWPCTTGFEPAWWRYASPRAIPTAIRWRVSHPIFSGEYTWKPFPLGWCSHVSPLQSSTLGCPVGSSCSHLCKSPLAMNSYRTSFSFPNLKKTKQK